MRFEGLESRIVLSTFNVATESDLRNAIITADSNSANANTINRTASITLTDTVAVDGAIEALDGTFNTLDFSTVVK